MPAPPVYLDECMHLALAQRLRQRGFTVTAAAHQGLTSADDEQHLAYAATHGWLLATYNRGDFERLQMPKSDRHVAGVCHGRAPFIHAKPIDKRSNGVD